MNTNVAQRDKFWRLLSLIEMWLVVLQVPIALFLGFGLLLCANLLDIFQVIIIAIVPPALSVVGFASLKESKPWSHYVILLAVFADLAVFIFLAVGHPGEASFLQNAFNIPIRIPISF